MYGRLIKLLHEIKQVFVRQNEAINNFAKGMILGNVINANGGGVYIKGLSES